MKEVYAKLTRKLVLLGVNKYVLSQLVIVIRIRVRLSRIKFVEIVFNVQPKFNIFGQQLNWTVRAI